MLLDVLLEGLAADPLDDVAGQPDAIIRIGGNLARRKEPHGLISDEEGAERDGLFGVNDNDVAALFFEAAGVRHQVAQGDGLAERRPYLEVEITVDIGIDVDLALLFQLHDRHPGEELGDGRQPEDRRHRIDGCFLLPVSVAVALLEQHVAVFHHQHRGAGDVRPLQLHGDNAIEERLQIARLESVCPGGDGGRRGLLRTRLRSGGSGGNRSLGRLRRDRKQKKANSKSCHAKKMHSMLRREMYEFQRRSGEWPAANH